MIRFILFNPVLIRELLMGLRSTKLRWFLAVYGLVPFVAIAWVWPSGARFYGGEHAATVWAFFLIAQFFMVPILAPILGAYTVSEEFENRTIEGVWLTLIPPWVTIFSKILSLILMGLIIQTASLPALSLVFYLGGVEPAAVIRGFAAVFLLTLFAMSLAAFFSAYTRRGHLALAMTYLSFPILMGITAMFSFAFSLRTGVWGVLSLLNPVILAEFMLNPSPFLAIIDTSGWLMRAAIGAGMWMLLFGYCTMVVARRPIGETVRKNVKPIDDPERLRQRRYSWPFYIVDPMRRIPPFEDGRNLVAQTEPWVHPFHRSAWSYRFMYPMWFFGILLFFPLFGMGDFAFVWYIQLAIAGLCVVCVNAVSITMDRQTMMLAGLRATLLRPGEYLAGKWLACWKMRRPIILSAIVPMAIGWLLGNLPGVNGPLAIAGWMVSLELIGLFTFAISVFCSKSGSAMALSTLGMMVFLYIHGVAVFSMQTFLLMCFLALIAAVVAAGILIWGTRRMWREEIGPARTL